MHCSNISAEFEFGGHNSLGAHPKNVAFGYDVGKISAGCLVWLSFWSHQLCFICSFSSFDVDMSVCVAGGMFAVRQAALSQVFHQIQNADAKHVFSRCQGHKHWWLPRYFHCLSVCLSVQSSIRVPACVHPVYVCQTVCLSVYVSVCLSVCQSACVYVVLAVAHQGVKYSIETSL